MPKKRYHHRPAIQARPLRPVDERLARRLAEIGRAYLRTGAARSAISALRGAVAANPARRDTRLELARALHAAGMLQPALRWCESLGDETQGRAGALRAEILLDSGRFEEAWREARRALEKDTHNDGLRLKAAGALLSAGRAGRTLELLSAWPGQLPPRAALLLARAQCQQNRAGEALSLLENIPVAQQGPEHFEVRARALEAGGADEQAIQQALREGLARYPGAAELRLTLAERLVEHAAAYADGVAPIVELLRPLLRDAEDRQIAARAWMLMGRHHRRRPDGAEEAESCLRQALALRPEDFTASLGLGELLLERGRPGPALPWLMQALLQQPGRRSAQEAFSRALCLTADDEAVGRWLSLLLAALPQQAADVLARVLRAAQHAGREEAYQDSYREIHRLKNLISVASSRLGSPEAQEARRELESLYREMTRLLERVRQPCAEREPISLAHLLSRVVEESGCEPVELVIRPQLPRLRADGHALGEALANLIRNARQATADGQPVRIEARLSRDGWLEVAVTDRGPGIALELQERIFEPGFTTRPGGSGLGLSIARRVIVQHGGSLSLFSAPGGPTTFLVRLPPAQAPGRDLAGRWPRRTA